MRSLDASSPTAEVRATPRLQQSNIYNRRIIKPPPVPSQEACILKSEFQVGDEVYEAETDPEEGEVAAEVDNDRDIMGPAAAGGAAAACDVRAREGRGPTRRGREEKGRKGVARAEGCPAPTDQSDEESRFSEGDDGGDIADAMEFDEGNHSLLINTYDDDADDEDDDAKDFATPRKRPTPVGDGNSGSVMSKRNNMDYRVAGKKREG